MSSDDGVDAGNMRAGNTDARSVDVADREVASVDVLSMDAAYTAPGPDGGSALFTLLGALGTDRDDDVDVFERLGCADGAVAGCVAGSAAGSAAGLAVGTAAADSSAGPVGPLRSWVAGWTHRLEAPAPRPSGQQHPAAVRRLAEAVVDVLLERRPAEQVRRWVSREVFGLLSGVTQRRTGARFAARSMVRSIRMHAPASDAVESTVLVQDGPRVRAVALRFERVAAAAGAAERGESSSAEWCCTALQFG